MHKLCYGCMTQKAQSPKCELCGFDENMQNSSHQLPLGTLVGNQYVLGRVLGQGGFGITYIGWDTIMNQRVAVKEYFPSGFAGRDTSNLTVTSYDNQDRNAFESNKQRFLREAESLGSLWGIPQIVRILRCFEGNGTAYIAMEYVEGTDLRKYLKQRGCPLTMEETLKLLGPIMEALEHIHKIGLIHRDISPDNIMVLPDGSTKLLDFGAARYVENADAEHDRATSTQAILKHGFAPPEQYSNHGALGPWTDIYAMCATIYFCLTGKIPPEAMSRVMEGKQLDLGSLPGLTKKQRTALEKGLSVLPKERFSSAADLWAQLHSVRKTQKPVPQKAKFSPKKGKKNVTLIAGVIAVIAALALLHPFFVNKTTPSLPDPIATTTAKPAVQVKVNAAPAETASAPVQNLKIQSLLELEDGQLEQTRQVTILSDHDASQLTWSSDDPEVATVSEDGTVTAVGYGKATITAVCDGQSVICDVYVDPVPNVTCTYVENATGLTITGYEGTLPQEAILPRKIDGKPVTEIGNRAFQESYQTISFYIPEGIVSIGASAFNKNRQLTKVSFPNSLHSIENFAFYDCTKLSDIVIPNSVTFINFDAFTNTPWLNARTEPFVICGDGVLYLYKGADSHVEIPSNVKYISAYAFHANKTVASVTIPDSVTTIGSSAFYDCDNLVSIHIPDSVTFIGATALAWCNKLSDITIPDSVAMIESQAFIGTPWYSNQTDPFVICGDGILVKYSGKESNVVIPSNVKTISSAFKYNKSIISVTIPKNVSAIDAGAFSNCAKLENISIPDSITSIGASAFSDCFKLKSISIPNSVTDLGSSVFSNCTSLETIEIPDSVTCINNHAFSGCSSLKSITIPKTVTSIGRRAFYGAYLIKNVTLSRDCVVGDQAFPSDCVISYYDS